MGSIPRVFHHAAKPITLQEFADAVRASCPPKYPRARALGNRAVGIATSGGVDSMALAFLFSTLRSHDSSFFIGDYPLAGINAYVIDHELRDNSALEAHSVIEELNKLPHVLGHYLKIPWSDILPSPDPTSGSPDPRRLSNMETMARKGRYRTLGKRCAFHRIDNLFFAHHADDQHETVLMRILKGHPARGLMGMRPYNDIPECYDLHGAYRSGLVDMMRGKKPPLTYKPTKRAMHNLRKKLLMDMRGQLRFAAEDGLFHMDVRPADANPPAGTFMGDYFSDLAADQPMEAEDGRRRAKPDLTQLEMEDGGVRICRPLLGFEKDRLIATCEANGIKWFEDPTNMDPRLTTRNTVRHLVRDHRLPQALQRPAILQLVGRLREKAQREDEEVSELLDRCDVDLQTNTGLLTVRFPMDLDAGEEPGDLERMRTVAALLVKKMISAVTPEVTSPTLPTLQGAVSRIFPRLATDAYPAFDPPKAFSVASVHFSPLAPRPGPAPNNIPERATTTTAANDNNNNNSNNTGDTRRSVTWQLCREPYPSLRPLPTVVATQLKGYPLYGPATYVTPREHWSFVSRPFELFDGRFWISLRMRLVGTFIIAPFRPHHAKRFRESLEPAERQRLEGLLAAYAPGKVRYTLPALYYRGEVVDWETMTARVGRIDEGGREGPGAGGENWDEDLTMLALPSLGVQLPSLGSAVEYEVRYRKVDKDVLEKCHIFSAD